MLNSSMQRAMTAYAMKKKMQECSIHVNRRDLARFAFMQVRVFDSKESARKTTQSFFDALYKVCGSV